MEKENKLFTISVWYKGQRSNVIEVENSCMKCGESGHHFRNCPYESKVCFLCKSSNHAKKDCPKNDGSQENENVFIFLGSKSPLSNWDKDYLFTIDETDYLCVEQYVMENKCLMFGDIKAAQEVMFESEPRKMRNIGNHIRQYDHSEWVDMCEQIIEPAVLEKFRQNEAARNHILQTGSKIIGETSKNKKWGIGVHISDAHALKHESWDRENIVGNILMRARRKLQDRESSADLVQEIDTLLEEKSKVSNPPEQNQVSKQRDKNDDEVSCGKYDTGTALGDRNTPETEHENLNYREPEPNVTDTDVSDTLQCRKAEDMETAILIGASNTKKLALNDDNLPINIHPCSICGTRLREVASRVEKCNFKPEKVPLIVVHLGSCDFSMEPDGSATSSKQVYAEYIEALNAISSKFNQAEIAMASIPPRYLPHEIPNSGSMNNRIDKLNGQLKELSKPEENLSFIDNPELYWEGDQFRASVFRTTFT